MLRVTTVILLSSIMLSLSMQDIATYAHFVVNNDYIVDNYCINTDKPELLCSGKCYLGESLEDNHDEEDGMTREKQERTPSTPSYLPVEEHQLQNFMPISAPKKDVIAYSDLYSYTLIDQIFHPPKFS